MLPEKLVLYCDNCPGQNKNNLVLQFLHWIVYEKKLIKYIELNFFIVGHSKHSNDRFFGYISKQRKTRDSVESYHDVIDVIKSASVCNKVIPVRNE